MNLDELRAVQVEERQTDSLQPLPESFYADVADYLEELREERDRVAAAAEDPFTAEDVRELTDEIQTAEEVVEAIYERRVGKVVKRGSLTAAGIPTDDGGLTAEEADLFEELVADIQANRERVLDVIEGEHAAAGDAPDGDRAATSREVQPTADRSPSAEVTADDPSIEGAEPNGADDADHPVPDRSTGSDGSEPPDDRPDADDPDHRSGDPTSETDRVPVRITRDVGEILGIDDRTYTLTTDDVVTLPTVNAEPLLDRDAAERID